MRDVLILGAGYAGLRAALDLWMAARRGAPVRVTLVHEVGTGGLRPGAAQVPLSLLLRDRPVDFVQGSVEAIDLATSSVATTAGNFTYDSLVVALGSEPDFHGIDGLQANALTV